MIGDYSGVIAAGCIAVADGHGNVGAGGVVKNCAARTGQITYALSGAIEIKCASVYRQPATGGAKRSRS